MIPARQTLLLVVGISAVIGILVALSSPPATSGRHKPISVVASITTTGRFGNGYSWHLSVSEERKARLTIDTYPKVSNREFEISTNQINQLLEALDTERFFSLRSDYGQRVSDGSTTTVTVVKNGVAHTVKIHFLMNWVHNDPAKLKEPARAVRVFQIIRNWFDDMDAVDLKKYEDMVLKAAGKDD